MMSRRDFAAAAASGLGLSTTSCGTSEHCKLLGESTSYLNICQLSSWECCGSRRSVTLDPWAKHFWTFGPNGMTPHAIVGTDAAAQHLAIREILGGFRPPGFRMIICRPDGLIVEEWPFPGPGYLVTLRFGERRAAALLKNLRWPQEPGSIRVLDRGKWEQLAAIDVSKVRGMDATPKNEVLWAEGDDIWMCRPGSSKKENLCAGHYPRFSPDGRMLYIREISGCPAVLKWPSLEVLWKFPVVKAGGLALWAPTSRCVVVEQQKILLQLFGLNVETGTSFPLDRVQSGGTLGNCLQFVDWGSEGPARLERFELSHARGK